MYDLVAVVVHIGSSLNRGHYISIVKSDGFWILFDDDIVDVSIFSAGTNFYDRVGNLVYHLYNHLFTMQTKQTFILVD